MGHPCPVDDCESSFERQDALNKHLCQRHPDDRPWTDRDVLHELRVEQGLEFTEMGDVLGCSDTTACRWCEKLDVKPEPEPWHSKETLRELYYDDGLTYQQIADELGTSWTTVARKMSEFDIQPGYDLSGLKEYNEETYKPYASFRTRTDGYEVARSVTWNGEDYERDCVRIHRLIAVAEYGFDALAGMEVHHKTGCPWDNRPENLQLATPGEHQELHARTGRDSWAGVSEYR